MQNERWFENDKKQMKLMQFLHFQIVCKTERNSNEFHTSTLHYQMAPLALKSLPDFGFTLKIKRSENTAVNIFCCFWKS